MTLVCKSCGIGNNTINPIYEGGDKITPDIGNNVFNPIYDGGVKTTPDINPKCGKMHKPFPDNSKKI